MRLTAATIRKLALKEGEDDRIFFDSELHGFGIRLRAGGSCTWLAQYAIARKTTAGKTRRVTRRVTIGPLARFDPARAREEAKKVLGAVSLGGDPALEKRRAKTAAGETVGACLKIYLERRRNDPRLRKSSYGEIERHLDRNLKDLHSLPISKLDRRSIAIELAKLAAIGPIQTNRTRASLVTFLNWCAGEGFIDSNPAQFTNKNPEQGRSRVLSDAELAKIWYALPPAGDDFADIVRLLMLTGQRRSEIGDLERSEIDFDRAVITLPPARTKNKRQHIIPLSAPALAILQARPQHNGRQLVFGKGQGGFSGFGECKEKLDQAIQIPAWTLHDIRRSVATALGNHLAIPPHVIEQILNHQSGTKSGVSGLYNRSSYEAEKITALNRWAAHLLAVIENRPSNITALRRA
jgi:integrase